MAVTRASVWNKASEIAQNQKIDENPEIQTVWHGETSESLQNEPVRRVTFAENVEVVGVGASFPSSFVVVSCLSLPRKPLT